MIKAWLMDEMFRFDRAYLKVEGTQGEWGAGDFANPAMRQQIEAASGHQTLPTPVAPQGLARLSSIWTAPIPAYAPPFMHRAAFGYVMSALLGSGLIILTCLGISWLVTRRHSYQPGTA